MGKVHVPIPAKLFVAMISGDDGLFQTCSERLAEAYGPVDLKSEVLQWEHSDYYRAEMGAGLRRMFIFFERLIDPGDISNIKHETMRLEQEHLRTTVDGTHRTINLDPGYVTEAKVVLATTKDFPHRVYIGRNIYAESTLHYSKNSGTYLVVEHTYPDFRTPYCIDLFRRAREYLRKKLRGDE